MGLKLSLNRYLATRLLLRILVGMRKPTKLISGMTTKIKLMGQVYSRLLLVFSLVISIAYAQKLDMDLFKNMQARSIGPAGMSGRVTSIDVINSDPDVIYVGTASGGLWKSESGGVDWFPIFDKEKVASIGSISIYQKNPSIIWVGTGEGNPRNSQTSGAGVYRSLDGGRNWEHMGLEKTRNIHRVIVHPENPDVVYVGAIGSAWGDHPERGVYKTVDGGKNWEKILYVNERTGVADMVMDPSNPDKLIVALWEYRRWPWFFKSGGEGSGIYLTFDGGKTWKERSSDHGLPKGELGRIGLAIAPSQPQRVYAIVESKKNALYRSEDGGYTWKKINDKNEIGNRPFYYADIFVDPSNENRLYSLHSLVSKSEDGGNSFEVMVVAYSNGGVHPDHHAWWIHPKNPDFMIEGNDGGMAITRDRGKTWRFVENLPLAQFYHINIDNLHPYNVYGGMQDNGSWRGPAYVWRSGGIRNSYWEELYFGDGFDVVPDPEHPERYGYAMSQGGYVGRYDLKSGNDIFIRPAHPDNVTLRFNWNAAIAQDPFDLATIYYGSQFLHKSTDRGNSWTLISPDLTTNDPEKQKQNESGGLTYDVTQAENFTTIVSIAPSPVKEDVIWVGTDDGNLQLTQDGGETWTNMISKLKEVPEGSWVAQIHPSNHKAGEAFVAINNYRRNDWTPYVYHTSDYGKTWARLADSEKVWGYALSIVQDPVAPNLLFLGTEFGLYVSIDKGENWNKWTHGYPTVSTMDMKVHPEEHDLVIGTFGRAAYVLDNILPLRELAMEGTDILDKQIHTFATPDAYLSSWAQATGTRFAANAMFMGQNKGSGAKLTYRVSLPEETAKDEDSEDKKEEKDPGNEKSKDKKVKIEVFDLSGDLIRTFKHEPDTGVNIVTWRLDRKGIRRPSKTKPKKDAPEPGGVTVIPGKYKIKMTYQGSSDSTEVIVKPDPRLDYSQEVYEANLTFRMEYNEKISQITEAMNKLVDSKEDIKLISQQIPKEDTTYKALRKHCKTLQDSIDTIMKGVFGDDSKQGIVRSPDILMAKVNSVYSYLNSNGGLPTETGKMKASQAEKEIDEFVKMIDDFYDSAWKDFKEEVGKYTLSPFVNSED